MIGRTGFWHPRAHTHWGRAHVHAHVHTRRHEHGHFHGRRAHGDLPLHVCAASVQRCMLLEVSNLLSGTTYCCAGMPIGQPICTPPTERASARYETGVVKVMTYKEAGKSPAAAAAALEGAGRRRWWGWRARRGEGRHGRCARFGPAPFVQTCCLATATLHLYPPWGHTGVGVGGEDPEDVETWWWL
jgi:hypothetical protein